MDEPIFLLTIIMRTGNEIRIHGNWDVLSPAVEEFETADFSENSRIKVVGFTDTADRAPLTVVVRLEEVTAMFHCRQY